MSAPAALAAPFMTVPAGHPARALLDGLLAELPSRAAELPGPANVVSELRGTVTGRVATPHRLYVSLQGTDSDGCFDAVTLHWSAGAGARWDRFPSDSKLPSLAAAEAAFKGPRCVEVLRYVPRRRLTFRADGRVIKVKRRSRVADSWGRAGAMQAAVGSGGTVRVPRLLGVDFDVSAYSEVDVRGSALSDLAVGPALGQLLAEAGGVHAALHRIDAEGLPEGTTPQGLLDAAERDAAWAASILPDLGEPLDRALAALAVGVPAPALDTVTCHGDPSPRHLLGAPGNWTVLRQDRAERGEAARDLALFVAGLAIDVPALADGAAADPTHASAVAAYLDGYQAAGGRIDERRLAWHLLAAYVHHACLLATKDRAHPAALAGTAARLAVAVERLEAAR